MFKLRRTLSIILIGGLLVMLTGCISDKTEMSNSNPTLPRNIEFADLSGSTMQTENKESTSTITSDCDESETIKDSNHSAVLILYGGWDNTLDVKYEDEEYVLSAENTEKIADLFYNHEKQVLDSPLESVATLQFRMNDDYLYSSMDTLSVLSGRIQGELVLISLTENECEMIRQIITQIVQDAQ